MSNSKEKQEEALENAQTDSNKPKNHNTVQMNISKNLSKKLARLKELRDKRVEKRKQERERRKQKIAEMRQAGVDFLSRSTIRKSLIDMKNSSCKVTIVIDCDYEDFMNEFIIRKLCKQLNR